MPQKPRYEPIVGLGATSRPPQLALHTPARPKLNSANIVQMDEKEAISLS